VLENQHICVAFKPSYDAGCWVKWTGQTAIMDQFHGPSRAAPVGQVVLHVADHKGHPQILTVGATFLEPAQPWLKGQEAVILWGDQGSHLVKVVVC
jgi:hypothetical protein